MPFSPKIVCCYLYIISRYGYPPPAEDTIAHLQEMKAMGFQSVELEGIREEHLRQMDQQKGAIKQALEELELQLPVYCLVLPGLGAADEKVRQRSLENFEIGCQTAHYLGASRVLDNAPLPPYQFPEGIPIVRHYEGEVIREATFPTDLNWNRYWEALVATYQSACEIASQYGLTYHLHPAQGVLSASTDAFLYFAEAVQRDNLRFNLDTANQFAMQDHLMLALIRLKDRIDYIHISDNRGHRIEHLPPGAGNIPWDAFFETLDRINFKGYLGLDIGGAESGVAELEKVYPAAAQWLANKWKFESDV